MNKLWSKQEIELLKKIPDKFARGDIGWADILKLFPLRSKKAIKEKLYTLGLNVVSSGEVNLDYLKELEKRGITL